MSATFAQQKPQWMPGQMGLNAGVMPAPGFTYANITINYDASAFTGPAGKPGPSVGTYNVWGIENALMWTTTARVFGGNVGWMIIYPTPATGSLVLDVTLTNLPSTPNLTAAAGGSGIGDLWLQPAGLGWHLKRADLEVLEGVMIPTGRYSPGASNNVGSGYFGNHFQTGTTYYITKNKGTSANLFTDWEVHGSRQGTNGTSKKPGQAFTDEWGLGQVLPLNKKMTSLMQLGAIGYDQFRLTNDSGTFGVGPAVLPANIIPGYAVHAAGGQLTYISMLHNFTMFFKYEHEYKSTSHTLGNTIVFGGTWTLPLPKPTPRK